MDRLDELATFLAILDAGSLAGAARRLRRSPPAVTRALAALEERLGRRLLERTTRRMAPTEAGRRLAGDARRVLADAEEVLRRDAGEAALSGTLRVTAPNVFGRRHVMPVVSAFLDAHPRMRVELMLSDRYLNLIGEGLDIAVRIGRLPDSGLVTRRVGQVRRMVLASPAYLAAHGTPHEPRALARHDIVYFLGEPGPTVWRFRAGARERIVHLAPRLIVNQVDAALFAAREGRGIVSALSYQVAEDVASGSLVRLLAAFERPALPVQLVVPSARHMAAPVRQFLDHAAAALAPLDVLSDPVPRKRPA